MNGMILNGHRTTFNSINNLAERLPLLRELSNATRDNNIDNKSINVFNNNVNNNSVNNNNDIENVNEKYVYNFR